MVLEILYIKGNNIELYVSCFMSFFHSTRLRSLQVSIDSKETDSEHGQIDQGRCEHDNWWYLLLAERYHAFTRSDVDLDHVSDEHRHRI